MLVSFVVILFVFGSFFVNFIFSSVRQTKLAGQPLVFCQHARFFASCIANDETIDISFSSSMFGWLFKLRTSISIDRANDAATHDAGPLCAVAAAAAATAFSITTYDRGIHCQ